MKIKMYLVLSLVITNLCVFISCSQDDIIKDVNNNLNQEKGTRAGNDFFNVTKIGNDYEYWYDAYKAVDSQGNFYYIGDGGYGDDYQYCIMKFDHQNNELIEFFPMKEWDGEHFFCFDNKDNLCYMKNDFVSNRFILKRIKADGSAVIEQKIDFPFEVNVIVGMCAAPNGNIFVLVQSNNYYTNKVFRISPNGILTDLNIAIDYCHELYKASGAILYTQSSNDNSTLIRINTNTGAVEPITLRFDTPYYGASAGTQQTNGFALNGYSVVKIRPNIDTDYYIATIPTQYRNSDNQMVQFPYPFELFMNSDGSIFYVVTGLGLFKLSL